MGRQTNIIGALLVLPAGFLLQATAFPATVEEMTRMADLVVEVTVTKVDDQMTLPNGASLNCFHAVVGKIVKGKSDNTIVVCPNHISEFDPPAPSRGGRFRMFLRKSPFGVYSPFSHVGFVAIP